MKTAVVAGIIIIILVVVAALYIIMPHNAATISNATSTINQTTTAVSTTIQIQKVNNTKLNESSFLTPQQVSGVLGGSWNYSTLNIGSPNGSVETFALDNKNFSVMTYQSIAKQNMTNTLEILASTFANSTAAQSVVSNAMALFSSAASNEILLNGTVDNISYFFLSNNALGYVDLYTHTNTTSIVEFYSRSNATLGIMNLSDGIRIAVSEYNILHTRV